MMGKIKNYRHFCVDVGDEAQVKGMFFEIQKIYGKLDILINNAGIPHGNLAIFTPASLAQKMFNTNLLGTFLVCREAAKLMQGHPPGRIINMASATVPLKLEGESLYIASKMGVLGLTQVLAKELAPFRITVNAVGPTPIKTDFIQSIPKEKIRDLIDRQSIKRMGELRDVSNVIDFFIRPESDFITGQVIYLGGV